MNGNFESVTIKEIDDETIVTFEKSDWHYQPPIVTEYIVDKNIFNDLESIFRMYRMSKWHNKKFTNMFINDGESISYYFDFKNNESIRFSSQIYPQRYMKKLKELDDVISSYISKGTKLPALVQTILSSEELIKAHVEKHKGTVGLIINSYSQKYLYVLIKNDTDEEQLFPKECIVKLYLGDQIIFETTLSNQNIKNISKHSSIEQTIRINRHLDAGSYKLEYGSYSESFELK